MLGDVGTTGPAVSAALDWLVGAQASSGELPSYASPLGAGPLDWTPDTLKFISALIVVVIDPIDDPRARRIVDGAVEFLREERESNGRWRYWSRSNERHDFTPPDVDDTACCSLAVQTRGDRTDENVRVLLSNRDSQGRFFTWIVPHSRHLGIRQRRLLRHELRADTRALRAELWASTEAEPDDVDGVVNANVVRYLGPEFAPAEAIDFICSIIDERREADCDSWHRNPYTMYFAVADGLGRGIRQFASLARPIVDRISLALTELDEGPPLDLALALLAVQGLDGPGDLRDELGRSLALRQRPDGSWDRSVFYFGGPQEVFGWASEAWTTACAARALWNEELRAAGA